jgi:selenocysteine lyase/cysteine desulfurase
MTWPEERARFPVLDRFAYLNAGTFGPLSRATLEAMAKLRRWEGLNGRAGKRFFDEMLARRDSVRALLAQQIHVPAENVALTDSTTGGVHVVVVGLGLGPGDEVVTTDAEHFGLTGPLVASGATLRIARIKDAPARDVFERVRKEVTPATRLIATSAVSWIDGRVIPWRELREATGVPVLVDGAQAAGAIDVDASAADWFTVSAQKWLCGPDATGALYVRDPEALRPRLVAYPSQAAYDIAAGTWEPKPGAARFDSTFTPAVSLAGLEAALVGLPPARFERAHELTRRCRLLLTEQGFDVAGEDGGGTLVAIRWPGDTAAAVAALYEGGVIVRELPGTGLLRASVGWWNDGSDLERLVGGFVALCQAA